MVRTRILNTDFHEIQTSHFEKNIRKPSFFNSPNISFCRFDLQLKNIKLTSFKNYYQTLIILFKSEINYICLIDIYYLFYLILFLAVLTLIFPPMILVKANYLFIFSWKKNAFYCASRSQFSQKSALQTFAYK